MFYEEKKSSVKIQRNMKVWGVYYNKYIENTKMSLLCSVYITTIYKLSIDFKVMFVFQ